MATSRTHVVLSPETSVETGQIVRPREVKPRLRDSASTESKRRELLKFLNNSEPAWKDEDHPEIARLGSAGWVRMQRNQTSERQQHLEEWYREQLADDAKAADTNIANRDIGK